MGHMTKFARTFVLAFGAACVVAALGTTAFAASKAKPADAAAPLDAAAQKQKDAAGSRSAYDSGVKSYQSGKFQPAVDQLSAALRGGGLASTDMARALYIRGLAYKKQSKPGLAISDLTSALWLKNGLNDADRQGATAERADAYRAAGLGDGNSGTETVAVADPNAGAGAGKAPPYAAAPVAIPAPIPAAVNGASAPTSVPARITADGVSRQAPDSEAALDAARARKLAAAPLQDGVQTLPMGLASEAPATSPAPQAAFATVPAPIPAAAPAASANAAPVLAALPSETAVPAAPSTSAPTSTVAGFFSDLFGGGSSAPSGPAPVTTASTTPPSAATSSWSDTTSVTGASAKTGAAAKGAQASAAVPAAPPAPAVKSGKYKVHIAAVRSRPEAEALAQKLLKQHGADLKNRAPQVDEAVIGSMGTFYRVRVSGYATADEPRSVCNTLRTSGFDCLVVTN